MSRQTEPSELPRVGDLEIAVDDAFVRRQARIQHTGWLVMAIILAAALLGVFGDGLFAQADSRAPDDSVSIRYQRIDRKHRPTSLSVHVNGNAIPRDQVEIHLSRSFISQVQIENIVPEPAEQRSTQDGLILVIAVDAPGDPGEVTIDFQYNGFGRVDGTVGLVEGPPLGFSVIVLP